MFETNASSRDATLPSAAQDFLLSIVHKGGPDENDTPEFTEIVNQLSDHKLDAFREIIKDALNENTLIGHGFVKPYGYPGDFKIIHSIYKNYVNPDPKYRNWDRFFQDQAGAHAVRNRKEYFIKLCSDLENSNKKSLKVLILGSGPATDVHEYLEKHPDNKLQFDLVDFDQNALDFAKEQNSKFKGDVNYYRINVLRYKPVQMYDLIWSAGLFDYFREKHFAYMINKYYKFLNKGGEFVIGNFSLKNPTKRLMEVLSDWYLNHRSQYDLIKIAVDAGVKEKNINVDMEDLGVNLFLHLR